VNLEPGVRIGQYEIESHLGSGGMGAVYKARDTRLNRAVALKLWQRRAGDGARELLREARAASALNHPNIVIIHELGETAEGDTYIVQEFIDGRTLKAHLGQPMPLGEIAAIGGQVARALVAAHDNGIVHRDIKPDNVMVRADGYVKVLDFGVAWTLDTLSDTETTATAHGTQTYTVAGTPSYMSPEQMSHTAVGPSADVFALGVVLYEMAAGHRPFAGATSLALATAIATETPVPVSRLEPELPRQFCDLVLAMLEKAPERRPTSQEVQDALAALTTGGPLRSRAQSASATTVGRSEELAQLQQAYALTRDGRSRIIGLAGEPGIGKTSLLNAFLDALADSGERPMVAQGRCSENLAGTEAYLPILEALDSLRSTFDGKSINQLMLAVAPTWLQQIGVSTLTAPAGEGRETMPAASRERMKRELAALLQDLSKRVPVVWVIDDLHWADVSTIDMLSFLASRFEAMRVLIVTCQRPSDMALAKHPFLAIRNDLQSRGMYEEIALDFLTRDDTAKYLALQFPGHRLPDAMIDEIHARTEGSPLFMADLVRYLRDTGSIVQVEGRWEQGRTLPAGPSDLPESVRGMIARKIERVDDGMRKLLLGAAVQGQEFDSTVLAEALEMDPADVEEQLEALERVHVFVQRGDEHEYPDRALTLRYRFVHVLYQNVLYGSLQPTRRASLSAKTAKALLAHHGTSVAAVAGQLAFLFEAARDFRQAAQFFAAAAMRSVDLFGFREALSLADRGLKGLKGLPTDPVTLQLELQLQMIRGLALRWVKGWAAPELEATFARARQLCQDLDDPPEVFPVLWNLVFFNMIRGNLPAVQAQLPTLRVLAESSQDPAHLMSVNHVSGVTNEALGDVATAREELNRSRELHEPARHLSYSALFGIDPGMVARAMSSRPFWALGYPDQALARSVETIELARKQRQPVTLAFGLIVGAGIRAYRGEAEATLAITEELFALCEEYELPQEAEWGRAFQGAASAQLGRLDDARAQLDQSLNTLTALRSGIVRTMFLSLQAEVYWKSGLLDQSMAIVDEALAYAESSGEQGFLHELHRIQGLVSWAQGDSSAAEESLRRAVAFAADAHARGFELRAATALARLLADTNRAQEGHTLLRPVVEWFTEGLDTGDVIAARHALTTMGDG
jgi:predicted ATPase/tRNA A-37 threonylcarbamoyl transferase component Bud32